MSRFMTFSYGESAKIGGSGRYFESRRAVEPVSVKIAMAASSRSSAEWAMHSQMVSATDSREACGGVPAQRRVEADLVLGLGDDLGHHGDGFDGILAGGGLAREHDGVGAVVDRVGDVGGLGAGGPRILDHRFQHLRRGDDRLAILRGAADDVLLDRGHLLRRDFDAEIAARDHDAVGDFEDGVEVFDRLRLLQLGDDPGVGLQRVQAAPDVAHVVGGTHEGDGDGVDALRRSAKIEVFFVLLRQRRNLDRDAGKVDALVLAQHAAVDDLADDVFAVDAVDAQLDQTVREQNAGAGFEVLRQRLEGGADERTRCLRSRAE